MVPRSSGDPQLGLVDAPRSLGARVLRVVLVAAVVLSPLLLSIRAGGPTRFTWRMFSIMQEPVVYEVSTPQGWIEVDLDGISWWERGEHVGTDNLHSLCDVHPAAASARRMVSDEIDEQVSCR